MRWAAGPILFFAVACSLREDGRRSGPTRPVPAATRDPSQHAPVVVPAPVFQDRDIDWSRTPVLARLGRIAETLTFTDYAPQPSVNERKGVYVFDCSAMAQWVLERAAPKAARAVSAGLGHRPLAADFQRRISAVPPDQERRGWLRVARVQDLLPGDVVAWIKPPIVQSRNTGHIAFVALPPARVPGYEGAYLVRIVDSTHLLHDEDTREGRAGFGLGTILLVADAETGAPAAYGWVGLKWRTFDTPIAMGRPTG